MAHKLHDNGIIEVDITPEMITQANVHSEEVASIKSNDRHSLRKGEGTLIGSIGELAIKQVYPYWNHSNTFDYDFEYDGIKIDIKTKDRTVPPRLNYEASISNYNITQKCDVYMFVSVLRNKSKNNLFEKAYIMGLYMKEDYMRDATFLKKGSIDPSNNWKVGCDCYNLEYSRLETIAP